ncbi:class I SAM-dependent methyltransferase [Thalassospiraceae bacterium LMO-SO8]|nr:class I SAM-dependent methyltransferase [Alphaproteobacteria bacterium LMO-S08]WND77669.1 class I SAM-dependent methyltransferase [Thalassospiraceae bacterium LMO-SO8]
MPKTDEFDHHAHEYADSINQSIEFSGCDHAFFTALKATEISNLLDAAGMAAAPCVLDIGCGVGAIHPHLRAVRRDIDLVGVDVSQASIDLALQRCPDSRFLRYDGRRLPFDDGTFDAAYAICVLHHVPPADRSAFTAELSRVVRPDGLGIVIEHNPLNPVTRHVVNTCDMDRNAILLRSGECTGLLEGAGFAGVDTRFIAFLPFKSTWARSVERLMARVPLGAQFITHGRKTEAD